MRKALTSSLIGACLVALSACAGSPIAGVPSTPSPAVISTSSVAPSSSTPPTTATVTATVTASRSVDPLQRKTLIQASEDSINASIVALMVLSLRPYSAGASQAVEDQGRAGDFFTKLQQMDGGQNDDVLKAHSEVLSVLLDVSQDNYVTDAEWRSIGTELANYGLVTGYVFDEDALTRQVASYDY